MSFSLRVIAAVLAISSLSTVVHALAAAPDAPKADAPKPGEPTDPKAVKTFHEAGEWERKHAELVAVQTYRKANQQDGGHCIECLKRAYSLALASNAAEEAVAVARDWLAIAQTDVEKASAHFRIALALQREGITKKKDKCFAESCDEFKSALTMQPSLTSAHYYYGISLARARQDDAAHAEFATYEAADKTSPDLRERAQRYLDHIDLARATMAPAFSVTTIDGNHLSLDSLAGKVVLIDFWATWCGPCVAALPEVQALAKEFAGKPFVVVSISLDKDDQKWRDFVAKNHMNWPQYRDGYFEGPIARRFGVDAIPATFTIDAEGVLEDQRVGDSNIEGNIRKLVHRADQLAQSKQAPVAGAQPVQVTAQP